MNRNTKQLKVLWTEQSKKVFIFSETKNCVYEKSYFVRR